MSQLKNRNNKCMQQGGDVNSSKTANIFGYNLSIIVTGFAKRGLICAIINI